MERISYSLGANLEKCNQPNTSLHAVVHRLQSQLDQSALGEDGMIRKVECPGSGIIVRSVVIIAIALGFVIGMYVLDHPASHWVQTALGLIVTGMVAHGYVRYCSIKGMRQLKF